MVVQIVLRFADEFCVVCILCTFSYFQLSLGNWVAAYWEIAAHL